MKQIKRSEELFSRSKRVSPGGVHSPVRAFKGVGGVPRFIQSAKGAEMVDVDGNRYIDFCMSWGPLIFGHQDPEIREAVDQALSQGWSYGAAEVRSLELAELITGSVPWVEEVRFVNSGTEAVMSALRVARGATKRNKILKFEGCYHGHVDSMLVKAGSGLAEMSSPDSAGVAPTTASETCVARLDDLEGLRALFEHHGNEIAAMIIEPLPANNGLLLQRTEFIHQAVELARKSGALVIFDEVISGFRVAFGGMAEILGIRPDLVTYGKVIGGGFPVGAYGGRRDLMERVAPVGDVYQAGTLSGNPVAMAAGIASLKKLKRESPFQSLSRRTEEAMHGVAKLFKENSKWPVSTPSFGSLFWLVMDQISSTDGIVRSIDNIPGKQKPRFAKLFHALLDEGIYLAPSGYEVGFLSTAHQPSHLEQLKTALLKGIQDGRISGE